MIIIEMGKNKGPETFTRMNYLYQAGQQLLKQNPSAKNLAAFYMKSMKTISTRTQSKMNPSIKRNICKKCNVPLIHGVTSSFRLKKRRSKHLSVRCTNCDKVKRYLMKGYVNPNPKPNSDDKDNNASRDDGNNQSEVAKMEN